MQKVHPWDLLFTFLFFFLVVKLAVAGEALRCRWPNVLEQILSGNNGISETQGTVLEPLAGATKYRPRHLLVHGSLTIGLFGSLRCTYNLDRSIGDCTPALKGLDSFRCWVRIVGTTFDERSVQPLSIMAFYMIGRILTSI